MQTDKIKCPRCEEEGHKYFDKKEGRYFFQCDGICRFSCLLKELNKESVTS